MSTVTVICRECGNDGRFPVCGWCMGQGHEDVDRAQDGSIPPGFTEHIPPLLPEPPMNPLVPLYQRCVP